jgi:hypothetical protein
MQLSKDLREFVELLTSNKVEYMVVGAFAVAWHGYARFTARTTSGAQCLLQNRIYIHRLHLRKAPALSFLAT